MAPEPALLLTDGLLDTRFAKTAHGLLRGSHRFTPVAVVDAVHAGRDAGEVMDGRRLGVPVMENVAACLSGVLPQEPRWLVVGVAFPGGRLPVTARATVEEALRHGLSVVCGLHKLLGDDPELRALAEAGGGEIVDIRRPRRDPQFWTGDVFDVPAARVAVLGTDCAAGKRTTCRWLLEGCRERGVASEMIYTGQTGWLQGYPYGFIFDATPNDFVSGELERAIVECDRERQPDLILIEGQSGLRNPSGPCGGEFLLSAALDGVVLQHLPGRQFFIGLEERGCRIPSVESEVELIRSYGVGVLAVTLNGEGMESEALIAEQERLREVLDLPVVRPLEEGVGEILSLLERRLAPSPKGEAAPEAPRTG
ncbi:MAG: DUF1611 domain-containing protein [Acidobacteriota bacterium]